jgi:hypothetical protein
MPDHRKPLAGRSPKYHIDAPAPNPSPMPDLGSGQPGNRLRKHGACREVVRMDSAMDGVDFDSGHNIETRLLEAQSKAPCASKQVDSDRPWHV